MKDGSTVVVKTLRDKRDHVSANALRHEYAILSDLVDIDEIDEIGVPRALEFEEKDAVPALVLQDAGTSTLRDRRMPFDTRSFLDLSNALATLLARVHARGVIHRDLCPDNIVLDPKGQPRLIDFELAVTRPVTLSSIPRALAESLPYVAPEQTGRMSRPVDQRSDLYSLGVIFYEMLTGAPPFRADNRLAIVHDHLARIPISPSLIARRVPAQLSRIVDKLLAKRPDDRYQTALALASDLAEARRQWQATGQIAPFALGSLDLALTLPLPDRLYGRSRELTELMTVFARVRTGRTELAIVVGSAGLGKSSLLRRFRDDVVEWGARFIEGKSDLRTANVPYASIVEAAETLVGELLALPPSDREAWRRAIVESVQPNGRTLTDLLPQLVELIGEQPPVPVIESFEARLRLQGTLRAFLGTFGSEGRPLVVFLDDLQWADGATLEMLHALAEDPTESCLLLVGAFRAEDLGGPRRLETELRRDGVALTRIEVSPLRVADVETLLADVLGTQEGVRDLATVVQRKTVGNPFFIRQLLRALQREGIITFDAERSSWTWDLHQVERVAIANDVADLLAQAIDSLPPTARAVLPIAACVGKRIDVDTLASVATLPKNEVSLALELALGEGLLVRDERHHRQEYGFAHDRVQKAAYGRLEEKRRQETHLRVGRVLSERAANDDAMIFDIADQMNLGEPLLTAEEDRLHLAKLDAVAGQRAQQRAAYGPALAYFRAGITALPSASWTLNHDLAFELHRGAAGSALVVGDHALVSELCREALVHASHQREKGDIHTLLVASATVTADWRAVTERAERAVRELGFAEELPRDLDAATSKESAAVDALMKGRAPESLADSLRPCSRDDEAVMRLLGMMQAPAWFQDRKLFEFLVARSLRFVLEHGIAPAALTTISGWSLCLCSRGRLDDAEAFARLAMLLAERFGDRAQQAHAMLVTIFVKPWRLPYRAVIPYVRQAFALAVDCSEVRTAAFLLSALDSMSWGAGADLDDMLARIDADMPFLRRTRSGMIRFRLTYRQSIRALKGLTSSRGGLEDDDFDEASFLASCRDEPSTLAMYELRRLVVAYILRDPTEAAVHADEATHGIALFAGTPPIVEFNFYSSLTNAALCERVSPERKADLLAKIRQNQKTMAAWLEGCPTNFRDKYALVDAEVARVEGRFAEAGDLYEAAIEAADTAGILHEKALACELAGRHAFARGRTRIADFYLAAARAAYTEWGATEKVRALDEEFPLLRSSSVGTPPGDSGLDLEGVLRVAGVLSREIEPCRLIDQLLRTCVAIAGAERAVLIVEDDGKPILRASGTASETDVGEHEPLATARTVPASLVEDARATRRVLVIDDTARDPRVTGLDYFREHAAKSVLIVPIERKAALVGVLYCENGLVTHAFTPARVSSLQLLAGQMASALSNSLLLEQLRAEVDERTRAERRVRFLADAGAVLAESLDYELTLSRLTHLVVPALADWCTIDLVTPEGTLKQVGGEHADPAKRDVFEALRARRDRVPSPTVLEVLRSRKPIMANEVSDTVFDELEEDSEAVRIALELGIASFVVVPLMARDEAIGAMVFASASPFRYGPLDVALTCELGRRAALAVDSAKLFREAETAIRLRDEFLSVAAHELNTPLTSLKLMVQGLTMRRGLPAESLESAHALAERQIRRLTRLVEQLLDVSRLNAGRLELERERIDLAALARDSIEQLADSIAQSGSTVELVASGPVVGDWDRLRLEQVVTNLLSNALKFGEGKPITVSVARQAGKARLTVRDRGIGIEPDQVSRIFNRFERAVSARSYGGLGLGLYIVRRIVAAHGGDVTAESSRGAGSTFIVEFPSPEEISDARHP